MQLTTPSSDASLSDGSPGLTTERADLKRFGLPPPVVKSPLRRIARLVTGHQMPDLCPFCQPEIERIWFEDESGLVLRDAFPISQGHALVISRQHSAGLFDLPIDAQAALWRLVSQTRLRLERELQPDGFNIGVNDGQAAGQTVMHAHIHVVPRWINDVADPRGGIRWIIPAKARYWGDQ